MHLSKHQITQSIKHYTNAYSGLSIECWQHILTCLLEKIATGVAFYVSIYLATSLHYNVISAGIVLSSYGAGTVFGGIAGGTLSDFKSTKFVVVMSLVFECILFFTLPFLSNIHIISLVVLMLGISAYMFKTANTVQVVSASQHLPTGHRLKSINILYAASNIGVGISAAGIGLLANVGFTGIFFGAGVITLLLAIYQSTCISYKIGHKHNAKSLDSLPDKGIPGSKAAVKTASIAILSSVFIVGLIIAQRRTTYPIYIHKLFPQYGMHGLGLLYAINPAMIAFLQAPLINKLKKFNKFDVIGLGAFLMGIGTWLLSYLSSFTLAIVACLVYTLGEILFFSLAQHLYYESSPQKKKGIRFGVFQTIYASSIVIGPALSSQIYHYTTPTSLWYMCGAIGILAFVICVSQRRKIYYC